jgi:hypothetical protein
MPPKANNANEVPAATTAPTISGKWLIIGIFGLALAAAGGSWLFRYNATHRTAAFWGPEAARLIRDAPQVTLFREPITIARAVVDALPADATESDARAGVDQKIMDSGIDVSNAHGLAHLRNALLEDRSFAWPSEDVSLLNYANFGDPYWLLVFQDPATGKAAKIHFSEDCRQAMRTSNPKGPVGNKEGALISAEPIASGLAEMFTEFSAIKPADAAAPSSAPSPAR